jgi:general secretion pathway protein D
MPFLTKRPVWIAIQSIATSALLISASGIIYAQNSKTAKTTANAASVRTGEPVTLNFVNADIEAVARTMATITGRNVVVDPRVKGQLNLVAERPVSPHDAFQQFLAALRLQGFTVVDTAGLYKVVPEADAKLQGGSVSVAHLGKSGQFGNSGPAGGHIVTQIFKLNYETAGNLVPVLRPLISPNNTININPGTNALVITDYADNLQRLGKIIAAMDVSNASDVEIIPLHHAIATELAPLVARLIDGGGAPGGASSTPGQTDTSFKTTLLAEPRSNALILRAANPARVAQVRALVAKLDQAPAPGSANANGNIHVVYLKNADATALATTLRAAMAANGAGAAAASSPTTNFSNNASASASASSNSSNNGASGAGLGAGIGASASSHQPSTGGQIQADPATNSLIITAPEPQYRQLRAVIDQLDGRRAQVLVESLIAEVNVEKTAQFGIQWQSLLGQNNNVIGIIGNNTSVGGANIFKLAQSLYAKDGKTMPSTGLNAGLAVKHNGDYVLGALANLLQTSGDGNVLSTPNLLTLDNEEAKILIGENVPFPTGSYANTGGSSSSVNPFTTVERKDVGLTLRVKPQINENGTVKLVIYQEISAVKGSVEESKNGPTTTKRSIESTVLVEDGSIIVLGGLLQDKYSGGQDKVPLLGDIPGVGALFRSDSRTRQKTNLMVFLRPVVLRSATASTQLSMDRYDLMRGLQQDAQPEPSNTVPINEGPLLPALVSSPSAGPLGSAAAAPAPTPASMQTDIPSWSSQ